MENLQPKNKKPWAGSLGLAFQLGYTIAIPLVVLTLAGRFLDKKLGTSPWLLLAGVVVSLIVTSFAIYVKISKIMSELSKCERETKKIEEADK